MQPEVAKALVEAANLLLVGMVMVFLFLAMLIGAITLIAWVNKVFPDEPLNTIDDQLKPINNTSPNDQGLSPKIVAAISAAVFQYKQSD